MPYFPAWWGRKSSSYQNNIHIVTAMYIPNSGIIIPARHQAGHIYYPIHTIGAPASLAMLQSHINTTYPWGTFHWFNMACHMAQHTICYIKSTCSSNIQWIIQLINRFILLSISLEPPPRKIWMTKDHTLRVCNLFKWKDHILSGKGRVFPLLHRGFKQHYPFAKVHCIRYVSNVFKKRMKEE